MTLDELKAKLNTTPLKGTFARPEFDKFAFGGTAQTVSGRSQETAQLT